LPAYSASTSGFHAYASTGPTAPVRRRIHAISTTTRARSWSTIQAFIAHSVSDTRATSAKPAIANGG
jgi:hypothetical protein